MHCVLTMRVDVYWDLLDFILLILYLILNYAVEFPAFIMTLFPL